MNIQPGCIPCIVKQAYTFTKMVEISDPEIQKQILLETMNKLLENKNIRSAPHFSMMLQSVISGYTDIKEIFGKIKEQNYQKAVMYINYLTHMIEGAADRLEMAVRASIAGNTIDLGANPDFDIEREINVISSDNINLDFFKKFKDDLQNADNILFIGDNYEEALFDKLLIKQLLPKQIVFAVRSNVILNDITMEDALGLGIEKLCRVIESGSRIAGTDPDECTDEFLAVYNSADMVIAKGQGNYETLINAKRPIYFMFKVKCDVIAEITGYPVGNSILYYHKGT